MISVCYKVKKPFCSRQKGFEKKKPVMA